MGLSWQQGPLAPGAIGRFLVPVALPERLLNVEPMRRRMRVRFGEPLQRVLDASVPAAQLKEQGDS